MKPCPARCEGRTAALPLAVLGPPLPLPDILTPQCREKQASDNLHSSKSPEQSENVYENKGSAWKSTTPDPSLSKEGNLRLPFSDEEGGGGGGAMRSLRASCRGVKPCYSRRNKARMSMKTKDDSWREGLVRESEGDASGTIRPGDPHTDKMSLLAALLGFPPHL
jgi:hypothetical protein